MKAMYKTYHGSLYGEYRNLKFCDVYNNVNDFLADYSNNGIPTTIPATSLTSYATVSTLFYLIYGKYGNAVIANSDINQFKFRLFSLIFQNGMAWAKKLDIQKALYNLDLTSEDWLQGSIQIYNHANNPSTAPSTDTSDFISYIDDQNVTKNKRGPLEGYSILKELIDQDVTQILLNKFNSLFLTICQPEDSLYYITEGDEE